MDLFSFWSKVFGNNYNIFFTPLLSNIYIYVRTIYHYIPPTWMISSSLRPPLRHPTIDRQPMDLLKSALAERQAKAQSSSIQPWIPETCCIDSWDTWWTTTDLRFDCDIYVASDTNKSDDSVTSHYLSFVMRHGIQCSTWSFTRFVTDDEMRPPNRSFLVYILKHAIHSNAIILSWKWTQNVLHLSLQRLSTVVKQVVFIFCMYHHLYLFTTVLIILGSYHCRLYFNWLPSVAPTLVYVFLTI